MACKPGSVPPPPRRRRDDHSSGPSVAGRFSRPTRAPGPAKPRPPRGGRDAPIRSCSRRGLPCRPGHPVRGGLLPHPFTLALLRSPNSGRRALRSPKDEGGRFAFCGAIPGVAPGGRYPPPFRRGARTFLPPAMTAKERPSGHLIRGHGERARCSRQAAAPPRFRSTSNRRSAASPSNTSDWKPARRAPSTLAATSSKNSIAWG